MKRRSVLKTLGIIPFTGLALDVFGKTNYLESIDQIYLLGNVHSTNAYLEFIQANHVGKLAFKSNTSDAGRDKSLTNYEHWQDVLGNELNREKNNLVILAGCRNPEKIIINHLTADVKFWIDRPLHLTEKELKALDQKLLENVKIAQIDQGKIYFSNIRK